MSCRNHKTREKWTLLVQCKVITPETSCSFFLISIKFVEIFFIEKLYFFFFFLNEFIIRTHFNTHNDVMIMSEGRELYAKSNNSF